MAYWVRLRATVVTQGWNGYRNKSQHRKTTLEKIKTLPPLLQGLEPATRVRLSNHRAIPTPRWCRRPIIGLPQMQIKSEGSPEGSCQGTLRASFSAPSSKEGCRKPVLGVCCQGCRGEDEKKPSPPPPPRGN